MVLGNRNGILEKIVISSEIARNVYQFTQWENKGFIITDCKFEKLALTQLWFSSKNEMIEKMNRIDDFIYVTYQ